MTWWGWLLLALYLAATLQAWRKIAWVIAKDDAVFGEPDGGDIFFGMFVATFALPAWPVVWLVYWLHRTDRLYHTGRSLLAPPRHVRREEELRLAQRLAQEREAHIARLERELGVRR